MTALLVSMLLAQADDPEARVRIAIALAVQKAEQVPAPKVNPYEAARAEAVRLNKPLVVGIDWTPPEGNWLTARVASPFYQFKPGLLVSTPRDGDMWVVGSLPKGASALEIQRLIPRPAAKTQQRATGVPASPFPGAPSLTADGDTWAASSRWKVRPVSKWTEADIPEYMEPYQRARFTQRISVTNGADTITPVSRTATELRWQVPGGMAGLTGWRSELYAWAPHTYSVKDIAVFNGSSFQNNRGWTRKYGDGTEFLDVLSNTDTGSVFEVRKAMKRGGSWQRFTIYRDRDHWPAGYKGMTAQDCRKCHQGGQGNEPGTGGYAVGLIAGGDTIFSHPFPELER